MEKALKYELRRFEVEAMDKITEDLEDAARQHNSKMLYWNFKKVRGSSQSGLFEVKDRNRAKISDKDRVKDRWTEHRENVNMNEQVNYPLILHSSKANMPFPIISPAVFYDHQFH